MLLILYAILSLAVLLASAYVVVDNAHHIANIFKVPAAAAGVIAVSIGTSLPEMVVALQTNSMNLGDMTVNGVIGSNICNIMLCIGLSALIKPLQLNMKEHLAPIDINIFAISSIFPIMFLKSSKIVAIHGICMLAIVIQYYVRTCKKTATETTANQTGSKIFTCTIFLAAIAALALSSKVFAYAITQITEIYSISQNFTGLALIAISTSMPEISVSVLAAHTNKKNLSLQNIVGSNIFNILGALGLCAIIKEVQIEQAITKINIITMTAVSMILTGIYHRKPNITVGRTAGITMIMTYIAYLYFTY